MLKNKLRDTQFVEEEIVIDVKYVNAGEERMMLIDSGAPKSIMSSRWFEGYLRDAEVNGEDVKKKSCVQRFRMGKTVYLSEEELIFSIIMKTDEDNFVKREVVANIINSDEVNFLCGKETIKNWKTKVDFEEDKLEFKEQEKSVRLMKSEGGQHLAKLELVGTWMDDEAVYLVKNEEDVSGDKAVRKIHKILNHKSKEQMYYAYRNAGKLTNEVKKVIDNVV